MTDGSYRIANRKKGKRKKKYIVRIIRMLMADESKLRRRRRTPNPIMRNTNHIPNLKEIRSKLWP